jgi:tetratricopeptide (TPR) repeat protein
MSRALISIASIGLSFLVTLPVAAQERDPATAQALFDQGRALMKAKNYAEACPKLAESQRLDPGIGTQFHLADCYENQGKLASAWATFLEVASLAAASNQPDREKAAKNRAARLESRLPRLTIVVPAASRVPGLQVTRDGVAVPENARGA